MTSAYAGGMTITRGDVVSVTLGPNESAAAIVTHVHDDPDPDGHQLVDLIAFPRGEIGRVLSGVAVCADDKRGDRVHTVTADPAGEDKPAESAPVAEWREFAVRTGALSSDEAAGMDKKAVIAAVRATS